MSASDYLEDKVLGYVYTGAAFAQPGTKYLALFTAPPSDVSGTGAEVGATGTGYARQAIGFTKSGSAPTQVTNTAQFDFPAATTAWGTLTHWATFDALSGGNPLNYGAFTVAKTIGVGDIMRIPASSVTITAD